MQHICEARPQPKLARPGVIPSTFEAGHTVAVDVVFFPDLDPRKTCPVLNVTHWGTGHQCLEPLDSMQSMHVWMKFHQFWVRNFGVPQLMVMDQGREFVGEFSKKMAESGCVVKVIGARAPWQQGRTERHGGLAKDTFVKLVEEMSPTTSEEWRTCVYAAEAAKNRLYNRSGYSPAQRQLGCNIRLPGNLGSDDPYYPRLLAHAAGDDVRRILQIRHTAMEAFLKQTAREVIQRSELARSRPSITFNVGDVVYVYRVPLSRRGDREGRRPKWVDPGTVLMLEGANVWLNMRGELWKCAREQVRRATSEEQQAADMLREEFAELKEQLRRRGSKRSFQDITGWGIPPAEDDPPAPSPPLNRPRLERHEPEPQQSAQAPASNVPIDGESSSSSSSTTSSSSSTEPEGEGRPEHPEDAAQPGRRNEQVNPERPGSL